MTDDLLVHSVLGEAGGSGRRPSTLADLAARLSAAAAGTHLTAVDARPAATALLLRHLEAHPAHATVVITRDAERASALAADLEHCLPLEAAARLRVSSFPAAAANPYAKVAADRASAHARLATLHHLARIADGDDDSGALLLVVPAAALVRKVVPAAEVRAHTLIIAEGDELDREALLARLTERGYLRVPLVEDPGSFAVRGGLLDVWPTGWRRPVRVDLYGDLVLEIRSFDPEDQRRGDHKLPAVELSPARATVLTPERVALARERLRGLCDDHDYPSSKARQLIEDVTLGRTLFGADAYLPAFFDLEPLSAQLPPDARVILEEPAALERALAEALEHAGAPPPSGEPSFASRHFFCEPGEVTDWLAAQTTLALGGAVIEGDALPVLGRAARIDDDTPTLAMHDHADLQGAIVRARTAGGLGEGLRPLFDRMRRWQDASLRVVFTARTTVQAERLAQLLEGRGASVRLEREPAARTEALARPRAESDTASVWITLGPLTAGVIAPTEGLVLVTEEEVFGTRRHRKAQVKRGRDQGQQLLADLRALNVGDHVVHVEHGIGRYVGLLHQEVAGHTVDLLAVEYAGGDKLYVPVYRLNLVQKLRGGDATPKLDRLGGQTFARARSRAQKRVREMADELLRLYAARQAAEGEPTPPIDDEYRAFEATFPFEETDDQARAIAEVHADLDVPRPMDRLVCGDVGFGKTEVALRAAFRVAMAGRQVAVLCPTTVLAQQHMSTFETRLGAYPLTIALLSRFRSKKQQADAVRGLKAGTVDIVVGTHRLLSKDVHFKNLGLLVVDEEQRFGVAAKERIKALRADVDVLTLSATPIPRTMQMAISGLRDLSLITTPPLDRKAVRTVVTRPDPEVLREAIRRELSRGGQVFYVFNRVAGLDGKAAFVQELVPEARVAVAHGQMSERALEQTMFDFVSGRFDILCSTAIIENGLDISRCNTIVIDRADLFGLGQLYQLRGRVGRSTDRAYCYLVIPAESYNDDARARVEALQRYSDLGAGFQIASLDMDLRGAGDLLGAEQSGTVATVGLEMFCQMLEQAVHELRSDGETRAPSIDTELSFDVEALLPEDYIADIGVRLSLYKRLASAQVREDVRLIGEEIEDRFGPPPEVARRYLRLMSLKVELGALCALGCEASRRGVTLHLRPDTPLDPAKIAAWLRQKGSPYRLTPDMRLTRRTTEADDFADGLDATEALLDEVRAIVGKRSMRG